MEGSHSHFAMLGSSHFPVPTPGCEVGEDNFGAPVWSLEETFNRSIPGPYLQEVLIHLEGWDEAESTVGDWGHSDLPGSHPAPTQAP